MPPREITIRPVLNGYSVKVGCQTLVFETAATLLKELKAYFAQPKATEDRYRKTAINKTILTDPAPAPYANPPAAPYQRLGNTITSTAPVYSTGMTIGTAGAQGVAT